MAKTMKTLSTVTCVAAMLTLGGCAGTPAAVSEDEAERAVTEWIEAGDRGPHTIQGATELSTGQTGVYIHDLEKDVWMLVEVRAAEGSAEVVGVADSASTPLR